MDRYFPPILTDANLDAVAQILADELQRYKYIHIHTYIHGLTTSVGTYE